MVKEGNGKQLRVILNKIFLARFDYICMVHTAKITLLLLAATSVHSAWYRTVDSLYVFFLLVKKFYGFVI